VRASRGRGDLPAQAGRFGASHAAGAIARRRFVRGEAFDLMIALNAEPGVEMRLFKPLLCRAGGDG
jgi:hypothetical protein